MDINYENVVSVSEESRNISWAVSNIANERRAAVIMDAEDESVDEIAALILAKHIKAFKELAK